VAKIITFPQGDWTFCHSGLPYGAEPGLEVGPEAGKAKNIVPAS